MNSRCFSGSRSIRLIALFGFILGVGYVGGAYAQQTLPNAFLEVAVRQREGGQLAQGIHRLSLSCYRGQCALETLTLNQCLEVSAGKPAFYPKVETSDTSGGSLKVSHDGRTFTVRLNGSDAGGEYSTTYRFEHAATTRGGIVATLTGFSGAYVKDSQVLGKVITVEYVPLPQAFQAVPLDCPAWLPGVPR